MNIRNAKVDDAEQIKELVSSLSHFYLSATEESLPEWLSFSLELK